MYMNADNRQWKFFDIFRVENSNNEGRERKLV